MILLNDNYYRTLSVRDNALEPNDKVKWLLVEYIEEEKSFI